MTKRAVTSAVLGIAPMGIYSLSYLMDGKLLAVLASLTVLGLWIGVMTYTFPGWERR